MLEGSTLCKTLDQMLAWIQRWSGPSDKLIVGVNTLARWRKRATDLARRHDNRLPGRTLQRYFDLRSDMQFFEQDVNVAVSHLDAAVDAYIEERALERAEARHDPLSN